MLLGFVPFVWAQEGTQPVEVIYPPDGAYVREVVKIQIKKRNPLQGYVVLRIDGKLKAAIAADPKTRLFTYEWDTKAERDGEHELEVIAIGPAGEIEGKVKLRVNVANRITPPEGFEGVVLREAFRTGEKSVYDLKVEVNVDTPSKPEVASQFKDMEGKLEAKVRRWTLYPIPNTDMGKVRDTVLRVKSTLSLAGAAPAQAGMAPEMMGPMGMGPEMGMPPGTGMGPGAYPPGAMPPGASPPPGATPEAGMGMPGQPTTVSTKKLMEKASEKSYTFLVKANGKRRPYRPKNALKEYPYGGVYLVFPDRRLRVGDEWTSEIAVVVPLTGKVKKVQAKHVLKGFEWQGGRRCVRIESTFKFKEKVPVVQAVQAQAGMPGVGPGMPMGMPGAAPPPEGAVSPPAGMPGMPPGMGSTPPEAMGMPMPGMGAEMPGAMGGATQMQRTEVEMEFTGKRVTYIDYTEQKLVGYEETLTGKGKVTVQVAVPAPAGMPTGTPTGTEMPPGAMPGVPGMPMMTPGMPPGAMGMPSMPGMPGTPGMPGPGVPGMEGAPMGMPEAGMPGMPGGMGMQAMQTQLEEVELVIEAKSRFMLAPEQ